MSNLKKINIFDERLIMKEQYIPSYTGASNISKIKAAPSSAISATSNQVNFSIPMVPSNYMPRYPMLHTTWSYKITATNNSGVDIAANAVIVVPGVDISMAQYPFTTNIISTAESSLNGVSLGTVNMKNVSKTLLSIGEISNNIKYSICPSAPELYASTTDASLTLGNSQSTFNDAAWDYVPNGSYQMTITGGTAAAIIPTANAGTQVITVTCETYEPLIGVAPFVWDSKKDDAYSLFALNNLSLNLGLLTSVPQAARALRIAAKSAVNTAANGVSFAVTDFSMGSCELNYFLMRPPVSLSYKVPAFSNIHSYTYYYNSFTMAAGFGAAGTADCKLEMKNYVSTGMPTLMMIWADNNTNLPLMVNDYKYPITNLTMELGGVQNILNLYDQVDLYNMSKDAGLQSSYLNFIGQAYGISYSAAGVPSFANSVKSLAGAPIVLRPGISFPLPDDISTNSAGSFTFNFTALCSPTNLKTAAGAVSDITANVRLNVLCIYDTYISIDTQTLECKVTKCPLLPRDVLNVSANASVVESVVAGDNNKSLTEVSAPSMSGAGLKNKLSSRIKRY